MFVYYEWVLEGKIIVFCVFGFVFFIVVLNIGECCLEYCYI